MPRRGTDGPSSGTFAWTGFLLALPFQQGGAHLASWGLGESIVVGTVTHRPNGPLATATFDAFFATIGMGLTVEEALTAMTLNAAASVGEATWRGSLEPGKVADVVLVDGPSLEHLVYHYGVNPVAEVVARGRLVVTDRRRVA